MSGVDGQVREHCALFKMKSQHNSVEIRSNMVSMMVIVLRDTDLKKVANGLQQRVLQAPAFFKNTPVVVDFSTVAVDVAFDFNALFKLIRQQQLLPVAIRGIPSELGEKMQQIGVPIVEQAGNPTGSQNPAKPGLRRGKSGKTLIVSEALSDGQQCYAQDGDLVLLASGHSGAELIADGNIYVYGALLGRAICGAHGDTEARIFCNSLRADLVSVAGHSRQLDTIPDALTNCPVQIRLSKEELLIEPMSIQN